MIYKMNLFLLWNGNTNFYDVVHNITYKTRPVKTNCVFLVCWFYSAKRTTIFTRQTFLIFSWNFFDWMLTNKQTKGMFTWYRIEFQSGMNSLPFLHSPSYNSAFERTVFTWLRNESEGIPDRLRTGYLFRIETFISVRDPVPES